MLATIRAQFWDCLARSATVNPPPPDSVHGADVTPIELARAGGASDEQIEAAIAHAGGIESIHDLAARPVSARFMDRIPIHYARTHTLLGLTPGTPPGTPGSVDNAQADAFVESKIGASSMPIAIAHLHSLELLGIISNLLGCPVHPVMADAEAIQRAINSAYQQRSGQAQNLIETLDRRDVLNEIQQLTEREDLLDVGHRAPVIKLVNLMIFEAVKEGASDVHVQPYEQRLVVRMRIDGQLFDAFELSKAMQEEVVSRVKVMGRMNIAEKRQPQDGRATVQVGDRVIDLRIASLPTSFGERVVIRLLDKSARLYTLDELGMDVKTFVQFSELITREHGLILVTGPTGSGKTTTLYAALNRINSANNNVLTLEDPIEYELPGVSQTQVNLRKGLTFASGLRNVLRQDPDIIMVGEIRDHETAVMAIQSALTGHLVFSTLHTNDAASAVTRLLDLGIEPYLVASSVIGVVAQRLVRRVCPACAAPVDPADQHLDRLGLDPVNVDAGLVCAGRGCVTCRKTGYRGRVAIFEMMAIDETIENHIQQRDTAATIKRAAISAGMQTLRDQGVTNVLQGKTTVEEVLRVTSAVRGIPGPVTTDSDLVAEVESEQASA